MSKIILLGFFAALIAETSSAEVCRGRWSFKEFKSCRNSNNGIETPAVTPTQDIDIYDEVKKVRTYTSAARLTSIDYQGPFDIAAYNQRCQEKYKDKTFSSKMQPDNSQNYKETIRPHSIEVIPSSITTDKKHVYRDVFGSPTKRVYFRSYQCQYKTDVYYEKFSYTSAGKVGIPEVYYDKPNRQCGVENMTSAAGFDNKQLKEAFVLDGNGQKVYFREDFTCSTGDHLKETTPKEIVSKIEFLLAQYRKSNQEVPSVEKDIILTDLTRMQTEHQAALVNESALLDMLLNIDFEAIDLENSLNDSMLISFNWRSDYKRLLAWDLSNDKLHIDYMMPQTSFMSLSHINQYGLSSDQRSLYFMNEYDVNISKFDLVTQEIKPLINLDFRGEYLIQGMFVSDDETLLVSHLIHSDRGNSFEEIALWDLVANKKLESIFKKNASDYSSLLREKQVTAFDQKRNTLIYGRGNSLRVYDVFMGGEIAKINLERPASKIYLAKDASKIGVIGRLPQDDTTVVEIFETRSFSRIDRWEDKGFVTLHFVTDDPTNEVNKEDESSIPSYEMDMEFDESMGMDDDAMVDDSMNDDFMDDLNEMNFTKEFVFVGSGQVNAQNGKTTYIGKLRRRNITDNFFENDIFSNVTFGLPHSIDQTPDGRYLAIASIDKPKLDLPYEEHLRVVDLQENTVVKDIRDRKFAINSFFIPKLDGEISQVMTMARIMKQSASDEAMNQGDNQRYRSLESFGIKPKSRNPKENSEMANIIANFSENISETHICSWATLPYRYQFTDGIVYVNEARTRFNVFSIDQAISMRCPVVNLDLGNGTFLFDRQPANLADLPGMQPGQSNVAVTPEFIEKLNLHGKQVTQTCSWAKRPYIYKFNDGYVYLDSKRKTANIFANSRIPSSCLGQNERQYY
ncbi:MAG: hypothetical protein ACOH5I_25310 [Oligoflexus sp.]